MDHHEDTVRRICRSSPERSECFQENDRRSSQENENFTEKDVKLLLRKKKNNTTEHDVDESHWKRTDKIVVVPPHLYKFVRYRYCKLTV